MAHHAGKDQMKIWQESIERLVPSLEVAAYMDLVGEIEDLKKSKQAVILGHNYMEPALYCTVTDARGDSLELARYGRASNAKTLVFCGVHFMAETAKILSPEKKVLIPSLKAGCSLSESLSGEQLHQLRLRYPGIPVVTYVNTSAAVKAETDICCTSSNAAEVVRSLGQAKIIFVPDAYLAKNVARETGYEVLFPTVNALDEEKLKKSAPDEKIMIAWPGSCEVHELFSTKDLDELRAHSPGVKILAHPECKPEVVKGADFSGSTSAMIKYVSQKPEQEFALLTECSMADNILSENKSAKLLRLCSHRCPHMAQITLEATRDALLYDRYQVEVDADLGRRAQLALERMLEIAPAKALN